MRNWKKTRLGDVLRLDLDQIFIDSSENYEMVGVLSFGRGLFHKESVNGSSTSYKTFYRLGAEHVVMSQLFGWEGALALSNSKFSGKFVSPQFPTFLTDTERLDREFLGWWLRQSNIWDELKGKAKGMGDRRRTLNPDALLMCSIQLPTIDEQRHIVFKIESLVSKIDEAKQLRQAIQADARALLQSAFQQAIEGAGYRSMAEVAPIVRRPVVVEIESEYQELGVRSFGKGTFHKPVLNGVDVGTKKLYRICPGDLVFSNVFAWEGAIAVVQPEDADRVGSHRFITCVAKKGITTPEFLCFYLLTDEGIEKVRAASPGGAGRNRTLGLNKLEKIEVPIPPSDKQLWFNRLQTQVMAIQQIQADNQVELDALLPSLLNKAFKGEL